MAGIQPIIAQHPKRAQIDKDIASGKLSNRAIARKYGITEKAVRGYLRSRFAEAVVREQKRRQVDSERFVYEQLMEQLELVKKLQRSAAKWLQDPEDPDSFTMDPRDWEIDVIYTDPQRPDAGPQRARLDELLARAEGGSIRASGYTINAADNRMILLKTFDSMARQLQTWVKATENAEQERRKEALRQFLGLFVPALMEATDGKQELRNAVGGALRTVRNRLLGE